MEQQGPSQKDIFYMRTSEVIVETHIIRGITKRFALKQWTYHSGFAWPHGLNGSDHRTRRWRELY
eukprot:2909865-Amphidinium_carterae.1